MGASIIEKHLIIDKKSKAIDSSFSITPEQLKDLSKLSSEIHQSLGSKTFHRVYMKEKIKKLKDQFILLKTSILEKIFKKNIGIIKAGQWIEYRVL